MPSSRTLSALLCLVLAATGCAAGAPPAPETGADAGTEVGAEALALRVPFDDYKLSTLDLHTIHHAEDLLTRDCMARHGFGWTVVPPPADRDPDPVNRRRYGLVEPGVADRHGYHLPPPNADLVARQAVREQRERLPAAERRAAYGDDGRGGCRAEARDRLRGHAPEVDESRLHDLSREAFRRSREHPAVQEVAGAWRHCLAEATGARYADPLAAADDPAWAGRDGPSEHEVRVAAADVACKRETGLVEVWSRAEHGIQTEAVRAHPAEFAAFRQAKDAELEAARRVRAEHG